MILCKDCKYLQKQSDGVSLEFIEGETAPWVRSYDKPVCQHDKCFYIKQEIQGFPYMANFGSVKIERIRTKGQAQLNKNGDCPYFEQKSWWSFR
jgi:hypothetical protein